MSNELELELIRKYLKYKSEKLYHIKNQNYQLSAISRDKEFDIVNYFIDTFIKKDIKWQEKEKLFQNWIRDKYNFKGDLTEDNFRYIVRQKNLDDLGI